MKHIREHTDNLAMLAELINNIAARQEGESGNVPRDYGQSTSAVTSQGATASRAKAQCHSNSPAPTYECFRCGYKPNGDGFTRNETRVLWRRDQGELEFIRACHHHANELEREGWHEQL